jgi:hypothetical protein
MNNRLWQRQLDESPADFTAFAAYLRLKGRRSARAVAIQTGRSPATVRRLSARFNWPGRVAAFEARLADATQDALDAVLLRQPANARAGLEQLRIKEFQMAMDVAQASRRWLELAANPRRRQVSLTQICRLTELASRLARLAAGMPTGDEPRRRPRKEDRPGYWTGPSVEEALEKIYGSNCDEPSATLDADGVGNSSESLGSGGTGVPASQPANSGSLPPPVLHSLGEEGSANYQPSTINSPSVPAGGASVPASRSPSKDSAGACDSAQGTRCDAWSRWARVMRRRKS